MRIVFGRFWTMHCEASTCSTSEAPMPKASQRMRRGSNWAVAADDRHPGLRHLQLGPIAWTCPADRSRGWHTWIPELLAVAFQSFDLDVGQLVGDQAGRHRAVPRRVVVGGGERLVGRGARRARRAAGRRTPAARSPRGPGAGRCRSVRRRPWASQSLSNIVCGMASSSSARRLSRRGTGRLLPSFSK